MFSPSFEAIKDQCVLCHRCPLHEERLNVLFGTGNEKADILFVSDGPRGNDDMKAIPFSGKSGELLDKFLTLLSLDKQQDIFITPIVKCRPPEGRTPTAEEMELCIEHLRNQVRHIKPKIILCFGEAAAKKMIAPDFSLKRSHGQFIKKGKLFFIGTFHPDEIVDSEEKRLLLLEDFQKLREGIEAMRGQA